MKTKYDLIIVGAGPAGIFTALEMLRRGSKQSILIIEKGKAIEKRSCPKGKTGKCVNCKPCAITTGFSGAGAFSDGKLSLSEEVGGDLPSLIGAELARKTIEYTDGIYLEFGADTHIEGLGFDEEKKEIRRNAIKAGLKLVDCPIRHLGTEKAQEIYYAIEQYLLSGGVEIEFSSECLNLVITEDEVCTGVIARINGETVTISADTVVVATGRRGADWLEKLCEEHNIAHQPGTVDIGVRVEVRNEVMERVNNVLYESKLVGHPAPFKNKVRTFCQNPGGFVSQENYDDDLAVVNGHSYKDTKSNNTNLAILVSHNFSIPFNQPIEYAKKVGELTNMLGAGRILVQRFGDILDGKRTWQKELDESNVRPTLPDAVAGDITAAMPYRAMMNIINFIKAVDEVVPGFAAYETLLYSPELKFYSNRVKMDEKFNTSVKGLYCLGDSSGWTRGLMMASVMGVLMGRRLAEKK
nr:FAD-binding protein [Clostridia bacterium]